MLAASNAATNTKVTEIKNFLIPMLSFGENSPYNEDANKIAKELLFSFKFFPTDLELVQAAPAAFATLLTVETCKKAYIKYVSD